LAAVARTAIAALAAGILALVNPTLGAAQQLPGATYSGTYTPSNGGFTLDVTGDGSSVASVSVLTVPGKMIVGTCTGDVNLSGPIPIVGGHFSYALEGVSIDGTFSTTRPGYVEGSVEIHSHSFIGPSARQVDPTKRDPRDECNIDVKLDWNAKARGNVAPVVPAAPAVPSPSPTAVPPVPTPTSTAEPTPAAAVQAQPTPTPLPPVEAAPVCVPSAFTLGFADLKQALGSTMGEPADCEHRDARTGDTLQATTTGLAVYRLATNTPTFTDGFTHWALTDAGLVTWSGDSLDPPPPGS
jgi:hypothetical protein